MVPIEGLHHFAWRCRDCEETRHFYEDILGLPLVHVIKSDTVPSTGEYCPYVHIFFRMQDGSCIAFFDLGDDVKALPSPNTPAWVNHLALRVGSVDDLVRAKLKLQAAGVGGDLAYITRQKGMFSYSGLSKEQMQRLRSESGVYGVDSGRICVAAINSRNIDAVVAALASVMRT